MGYVRQSSQWSGFNLKEDFLEGFPPAGTKVLHPNWLEI
jgi:hypothetical protein